MSYKSTRTIVNAQNRTDYIIRFETEGLTALDQLHLFAHLVECGLAWQLQGSYGRAAAALVHAGYITSDGRITARGLEAADEN